MHFHEGMTHEQIARRLHTSRVTVTRLIKRAREAGIVEIRVLRPVPPDLEVSSQLERHFGVEAIVVESSTDVERTLHAVAQAAVEYLMYELTPGLRIGFGWSSTLSRMATYLRAPKKPVPCTVIDLVGSMLGRPNPYSVSGRVANALGATLAPLPVPAVVESAAARDAILQEPALQQTLNLARQSDLAFVGIGEVAAASTLVELGYMSSAEMERLRQCGAVGDILMRFFDIEGRWIETATDSRVLGLVWQDLQQLPRIVVVASGLHKAAPLLGILRSGLCHVVITDVSTAQGVLDSLVQTTASLDVTA